MDLKGGRELGVDDDCCGGFGWRAGLCVYCTTGGRHCTCVMSRRDGVG